MITTAALSFPGFGHPLPRASGQRGTACAATAVTCSNAFRVTIYNCRISVPGRGGQVPVIGDLIQQRQHIPGRLPGSHRVHHHQAHRGQHPVDPPRRPRWCRAPASHYRPAPRTNAEAGDGRARVLQPAQKQLQVRSMAIRSAASYRSL